MQYFVPAQNLELFPVLLVSAHSEVRSGLAHRPWLCFVVYRTNWNIDFQAPAWICSLSQKQNESANNISVYCKALESFL